MHVKQIHSTEKRNCDSQIILTVYLQRFRKNNQEHIQAAEFLNSLGREKAQYIVKAIRAYQFMDARTEKQQDGDRVVYEYQTIKQIVLQIMSEHENVGGIPVDMPEYQTSCVEDNMNAESNILDGLDESAVDGIMNSLLAFQNNK